MTISLKLSAQLRRALRRADTWLWTGVFVIILTLGLGWQQVLPLSHRLDQAQSELEHLRTQASLNPVFKVALRPASSAVSSRTDAVWPNLAQNQALTTAFSRELKDSHLNYWELSVGKSTRTPAEHRQTQTVNLELTGRYADVTQTLSSLLAQHVNLALVTLQVRRDAQQVGIVEATVNLEAYYADTRGDERVAQN